jgi:hypothetical protein
MKHTHRRDKIREFVIGEASGCDQPALQIVVADIQESFKVIKFDLCHGLEFRARILPDQNIEFLGAAMAGPPSGTAFAKFGLGHGLGGQVVSGQIESGEWSVVRS